MIIQNGKVKTINKHDITADIDVDIDIVLISIMAEIISRVSYDHREILTFSSYDYVYLNHITKKLVAVTDNHILNTEQETDVIDLNEKELEILQAYHTLAEFLKQ